MSESGETGPVVDRTTMAVRGALRGDPLELEWLLERFTPLLMTAARRHVWHCPELGLEPEDLVQEVWAIAIPRLPDIEPRAERYTPVLLAFLASTMRLRLQTLLRAAMRNQHDRLQSDVPLPAATTGVVTRVLRDERTRQLLAAIDELDEAEREVVVMRAIEQIPNHEVALVLGLPANTVAKRYGRALDRLRGVLQDYDLGDLQPPAEEDQLMSEDKTVDPNNHATYCKWDGDLKPVGSRRCNPVTQKLTVCRGNDKWEDTDEDCPPGGYEKTKS